MNYIKLYLCCILVSIGLECKAQPLQFNYKTIPKAFLDSFNINSFDFSITKLSTNSFDATLLLPPDFVKDGSVDYTKYLQNAINLHENLTLPNFPVLINSTGLNIKSNRTIIFKRKSKLVLAPNDKSSYAILSIYKASNVTIYKPQIVGDRDTHQGQTGEWGMGISIKGSKNVNIVNPNISSCWGDAIYIGDYDNTTSRNINIYNAKLDYNRRNGISVISVDSLKIINCLITNTFGTAPQVAIDLEPNTNSDTINNVLIDNITTFNAQYGVVVGLGKMPGVLNKEVNITIRNHIDEQSKTAFWYGGYSASYSAGKALNGHIKIINPDWRNNLVAFKNNTNYNFGPNVEFNNVKVTKKDSYGNVVRQLDAIKKMKDVFSKESKVVIK